MYNGIGLQTARGSGTNGYVQTNKAFIRNRKERVDYKTEADFKKDTLKDREPNLEILEHERKRKLEVKCMELRELMETQSFSSEQIEKKVTAFREKLLEKDLREHPKYEVDEEGRPIASGTHQNAAANLDRNQKLRNAFGIASDYVDGSSLDPLRKQRELEKRMEQKKYKILKEPAEQRLAIQPKHGKHLQITEKGESVKRRDGAECGKGDRKNLTDDDKTVKKPVRRDLEAEKEVRKGKNDYRGHGVESSANRNALKAEKSGDRRKGSPDRNRKRRRSSSASSSSSSHSDAGRQKSPNRYPGKESSSDSDSSSDVLKEVPRRSISREPLRFPVRPSVRTRSPAKDGSPNPSPWKPERVKVEARSLSPRRFNSNYRRGSPPRVRPVSPVSRRPLESRRKSRTPDRQERQRSPTPNRRQRSRSRTPERRRRSGRDHSRSRSRSRDYRRERSRSDDDRRRRSGS